MTPLDLEAIRNLVPVEAAADAIGQAVLDLLALVEMQTRALLDAEWGGVTDPELRACETCKRYDRYEWQKPAHRPGCTVDAALTACGLDTQEKRDAKRRETR